MKHHPRQAFTLMEVLLALALGSILLSAVWTSLDLFWRYSEAGREESDQLQIARAVFHSLEQDLRSAIPEKESSTTSTTGGSPTASSSTSNTSSTGTSGTNASTDSGSNSGTTSGTSTSGSAPSSEPPTPHLIGDRDALIFQTLTPPGLEQAAQTTQPPTQLQGQSPFRRDLQWIGWSSTGKLPSNIPSTAIIPPPPQWDQQSFNDKPPVLRWQMDVLGAVNSLSSNAPAPPSTIPEPIPEIQRLQFRYYDGTQWRETWDSNLVGGLPPAIEVEIDVASFAENEAVRESIRQNRPRKPEFRTHKRIILVPITTSVRQPATTS